MSALLWVAFLAVWIGWLNPEDSHATIGLFSCADQPTKPDMMYFGFREEDVLIMRVTDNPSRTREGQEYVGGGGGEIDHVERRSLTCKYSLRHQLVLFVVSERKWIFRDRNIPNNKFFPSAKIDSFRFSNVCEFGIENLFRSVHWVCSGLYLNRKLGAHFLPLEDGVGLHYVQLTLHRMLLPQQKDSSEASYNYASHIETEPAPLSPLLSIVCGAAIIGISVIGIIYFLKRDNCLLIIGLFVLFIPFFLGGSLLFFNKCPPYGIGLYKILPICRYQSPYH